MGEDQGAAPGAWSRPTGESEPVGLPAHARDAAGDGSAGGLPGDSDGDADAVWKPGYTGPPPRLVPPAQLAPASTEGGAGYESGSEGPVPADERGEHEGGFSRSGRVDPWSRSAASRAAWTATPPSPDEAPRDLPAPVAEEPADAGGPATTANGGRSGGTAHVVLGALVVAAVLVVGLVVVSVVGDSTSDGPQPDDVPALARSVDQRWAVGVDGPVYDVVGADDVVVVTTATSVVALSADDGGRRWAYERVHQQNPWSSIDGGASVADGVVVVVERSGPESEYVVGLGLDDGRERWRVVVDDDAPSAHIGVWSGRVARVAWSDEGSDLTLYDVASGEPDGGPYRVRPGVTAGPTHLGVAADDGTVELLDVRSLERVPVPPTVPAPGDGSIAVVDGEIVVVDGDRVSLLDDDGEVADSLDLDVGVRHDEVLQVLSVSDPGIVALATSRATYGVRLDRGRLVVAWHADVVPTGEVLGDHATVAGTIGLLDPQAVGAGLRAGTIDLRTGEVVLVDGVDDVLSAVRIGHDGFATRVTSTAGGAIEGRGFDREVRWTLPADGVAGWWLGDGLVIVETEGPTRWAETGETTLVAHG